MGQHKDRGENAVSIPLVNKYEFAWYQQVTPYVLCLHRPHSFIITKIYFFSHNYKFFGKFIFFEWD